MISEYASRTPSGLTSIDGPTGITDLDKTEANKRLVRDYVRDVLIGENPENMDEYISGEKYIQHSGRLPDGLEHFKQLVMAGDKLPAYEEMVLLVGQGDFVATLCKAAWEGRPLAQVDIFRIEAGKIVEHWDNAEPVPPEEEWANSGKF